MILSVLVLCVLFAAVLGLPQRLWNLCRRWRAVWSIPGRPSHWFWGHLQELAEDTAFLRKRTAYIKQNRYKLTKMWLGPLLPCIQVTHCQTLQEVSKLPKASAFYAYLMPWLGEGLLIAQDKKLLRNRRLLTPAFHYEILQGYIPIINDCLPLLLEKWADSAKSGASVCVFNDIGKLSLDVLMQCAFSHKSECQLSQHHPYISAIHTIMNSIRQRFRKIWLRSDFIYYRTAQGKKFAEACKVAHDFTESVIEERRGALGIQKSENLARSEKERESMLAKVSKQRKYLDFLDILLTAQDEDGRGLSDLEVRDEADTFMFEGHDTTTSGMSWTLYCLALHPEHQDKIREEVRSVLMGREWLEYDDLKELNYTTWCIKEAMRLYPPVFHFFRTTHQDTMIDGHLIPRDMLVIVQVMQIHRHPDSWEDPEQYNPLRFHPSGSEGRHPYAYVPFSAGPRNCIGQAFALNEEKVIIASIINRFRVVLDETHEVKMLPKIVLRAKNDLKIKLQLLEN